MRSISPFLRVTLSNNKIRFGTDDIPPFIVVALKGRMEGRMLRAVIEAKNRGNAVVFAVMHRGEDLEESRKWSKKLCGYLLDRICFEELVGILKKSEGVYSMRLHALIAAQIANIPTHTFGNESKIKDFSKGKMY